MNLNDASIYDLWLKEALNKIQPEIWKDLGQVTSLSEDKTKAITVLLIGMACGCQNVRNISLGRMGILEMPKEWVMNHIEEIAQENINFEEEWEYRRLVELYLRVDDNLAQRLIDMGLKSSTPEIVDAAKDYTR